ncbi:MAG: EAL domain-containing protein [Gammaproteobacteria bacterium]|nr:EAL domain-containing protein [Gammaproteobacteria bacterium]
MLPISEAWLSLILAAIAAVLAGGCVHFWRSRKVYMERVARLNREVHDAAEKAAFGKRIALTGPTELAELGDSVNRLFDALNQKDIQLRERESLFRDLAETMPEVVLLHRDSVIFANQAAADLVGASPEHLAGRPVTDLVRPAYRAMTRKLIEGRLSGEAVPNRVEIQMINGSERSMWVELSSAPIEYRGQPVILSVARDISYRKSIEATLGRSKQQAQFTLESIGEGVITTDTQGRIDYMNAAAEMLTGTKRDAATGKHLGDIASFVDESDRRDLGDPVGRALTDRRRASVGRRALMISADSDREMSVELTASPIKGPDGEVAGAVVIMHDVTEIRGLTQRMSYQATHDALTGLINRREFERRLDEALRTVRNDNTTHVLCYLDLDRFKAVNDTCGHLAGDNLLREIAGLIREQVRESDSVARLGGDEFGLLLTRCPLDKARQIADDVCKAVRDHRFVWQEKIFTVGVSIGLVEVGSVSGTIKDLLAAADSACYVAKQHGRGQTHVYSARDEAAARQRGEILWLGKLQAALKEDGFELFFQPIVATAGRVRTGPAMEALLRLRDDEGSIVLPKQFLKAAERYQLMGNIDRWVVRATLAAIGQGTVRLPDERSCTINLSGQTLGDDEFLEFVVECLDHSQVAPSRISFEISEPAVMADLQHARRFVGVLHGMGCQFGVDDFGSGIGSLASLRQLSIDFLKIDGAYTRNLMTDSVNHQVVSAITRLARTVGFQVIAEQVEDQADFDALRELQVDFIQGHYINRPAPLGARAA